MALASEIPHTIKVAPNPYEDKVPLSRYTCFVHVLKLARCGPYIRIAERNREVFAGSDFINSLIESGDLKEVEDNSATDGDLVIYFQDGVPTHAGILASGRVRSKWGVGLFHEHDFWEVPKSYGEKIRFFRPISREETIARFLAYARSKGVNTVV